MTYTEEQMRNCFNAGHKRGAASVQDVKQLPADFDTYIGLVSPSAPSVGMQWREVKSEKDLPEGNVIAKWLQDGFPRLQECEPGYLKWLLDNGRKEILYLSESPYPWHPISSAPKDGTLIQAWHIIWKCPVSVRYASQYNNCPWETGTKDNKWPNEAFSHYRPLPPKPKEI